MSDQEHFKGEQKERDLTGLREQIKENATIIFPAVVEQYRTKHLPAIVNKRDAFTVFVQRKSGLQYQAILTCEISKTFGSEVRYFADIAAMGEQATEVHEALSNLLDVTAVDVGGRLRSAMIRGKADLDKLFKHSGKFVNPFVGETSNC